MTFCVECGKKGKTYNGLCIDCYIKSRKFFEIPSINISICRNCGAYYINKWRKEDMWKDIEEYLKRNIKAEIEYEIEIDKEKNKIILKGNFEGKEIRDEEKLKINFKKRLCEKCSLQKGGYFEAIVQVRGIDEEQCKEIEKMAERKIEEKDSFISKKERKEYGIDFYIGSKKAAISLAKEIKEKFGGEMKKSSSLVGMKDGKRIYRDTYAIRLPEYKAGKYLKFEERLYKIVSIGKKIEMEDVESKDKKQVYREELKKAIKVDLEEIDAIVLHEDEKGIYVMDTKNYRTFFVKKPKKWKKGKKIKIVEYNGRIYAVN